MAVYDTLAKGYDLLFEPLERWALARWRSETIAYLPRQARLLELGAGTGLNFRHYPPASFAAALEISKEMIKRAKRRVTIQKLVQADAEKLPFADASFDAAFATLVFCSIPQPENTFSELQRVVKHGGKIVLLEHVRPDGMLGRVFDVLNFFTVLFIQDHFNRCTAKIAEDSGLKVLEVKKKLKGTVNLIVCENSKVQGVRGVQEV